MYISLFIYTSLSDLNKKDIDIDQLSCPLCNIVVEDLDHLFLRCMFVAFIWS